MVAEDTGIAGGVVPQRAPAREGGTDDDASDYVTTTFSTASGRTAAVIAATGV